MNIPCEQLRSDLSLEIANDEVLPKKEMYERVMDSLNNDNCQVIEYGKFRRAIKYVNEQGKTFFLLVLAVSYMGGNGQHQVCRHRSQLKTWYKDFYNDFKTLDNEVKIIGVYHYKGNIIFVDFTAETYLNKKMHNSAAWVYTNDLYQAMRFGMFTRVDKNGNKIVAVKYTSFRQYLNGLAVSGNDHLFKKFATFNASPKLIENNIEIGDAIKEMHDNHWFAWKETEWMGFYLEYLFNNYIEENKVSNLMIYTGKSHKSKKASDGTFDFDIWFPLDQFYGDLKASDISKKETPGNDQVSFIECINLYDRFWYVIYEAECEKNEHAAEVRRDYLKKLGEVVKPFDPTKNHRLLKEKITFKRMMIIELNRINFRIALTDFNQGRQTSGAIRAKKFKLDKNNLDNFVVYSEVLGS